MSDDTPLPEVEKEVLKSWREKHWKELDVTMKVLKSIRDDDEANNKDRIEAGKAISRMLGVLAAEKVDTSKTGGIAMIKPALKSKHMDELEELLANL